MLIPYRHLQAETLRNLIADFVSRDGTDNGDETPETIRITRVEHALASGQALIYFDAELQQCILASRDEVPKEMREAWTPDPVS
mgnify:CR=1 FL=1